MTTVAWPAPLELEAKADLHGAGAAGPEELADAFVRLAEGGGLREVGTDGDDVRCVEHVEDVHDERGLVPRRPEPQPPEHRSQLASGRIKATASAVVEDAVAGANAGADGGLHTYRQALHLCPSRSFRKQPLHHPRLKAPRQNLNRLRRQSNLNLRRRKAPKLQSNG